MSESLPRDDKWDANRVAPLASVSRQQLDAWREEALIGNKTAINRLHYWALCATPDARTTPSHARDKCLTHDAYDCRECTPSTTPQKRDYRNCASGTCQNTDGCIVTGCRSALYLAQSALRRWTDLYAKLQNESGEVVSRKLDYNLPPADHVKALEALDEALACTASAIAPKELSRRIALRVAEIPDRTSPDDQPEMMLVTPEELRRIVEDEFESLGEKT